MSNKYDSISPHDESFREYFNLLNDMVSEYGLETQIAPGSNDNILQILSDGNCICKVDGQSGNSLYSPHPKIFALVGEFSDARIRIPFVSDMECEAQRLALLAELDEESSMNGPCLS